MLGSRFKRFVWLLQIFHNTVDCLIRNSELSIIGAMYTVEENEVDIFAIGSIYDTIVDLNNKIK